MLLQIFTLRRVESPRVGSLDRNHINRTLIQSNTICTTSTEFYGCQQERICQVLVLWIETILTQSNVTSNLYSALNPHVLVLWTETILTRH
jgi:hypothetical protein